MARFAAMLGMLFFLFACSKSPSNRLAGRWIPLDPGLRDSVEDIYGAPDAEGVGTLLKKKLKGRSPDRNYRYRVVSDDAETGTVCYRLDIGEGFNEDILFCADFSEDGKTLIRSNDYSLIRPGK